ncbi:DNA topoisomerase IB [Pelagibacterium halotolerans]|uniref:DNA topoisomerase IB (Poxvirus type) n=1 Tax=Pelagibacterium halotolerans (strain DSM 22347 / JCM 15775 / CGMCC 1.7692 / B2) TaxID=1082931 RepID=G4RCU6_PELHB|nr:DNA topoisomerase IB [Pelagibacterium halotolerans]AEQ51751.1 DNA topoisomerase IB (poxvirus type) [Pelagibacterium halotolerans B2]QJR18433.1 DNA topoisomerase IB [Pelagibacterium halotolerans]SEA22265.1 DNA topoisomerase-1 [Pelagibacterium halotolerans]
MAAIDPGLAAGRLRYVNDDEPGIFRRARGKGFSYVRASGRPVKRAGDVARIRALAIPPAWSDVWICQDSNGHIQATGRDEKGRKQYRYHDQWHADRGRAKYALLAEFSANLAKLRKVVEADLRARGLPREKVVASVVWLMDHTMIRVGNDTYARDNKSFGLTTLRSRHIEISGATLRFRFKGKSGREWDIGLSDRRMARVLRAIEHLPGQRLFRYRDDDGMRDIASHDVNEYIRGVLGERSSSKDFRTWGGTVRALTLLSATEVPETRNGRARALNAVIDTVSRYLGNTRAVCRACYIHPAVVERWERGTLAKDIAEIRAKRPRRSGLDSQECLVAVWLEKFAGR